MEAARAKTRAQCASCACWDLCGGRPERFTAKGRPYRDLLSWGGRQTEYMGKLLLLGVLFDQGKQSKDAGHVGGSGFAVGQRVADPGELPLQFLVAWPLLVRGQESL